MGRCVVAVLLALSASCTKRNPAACCTTESDCEQQGLPPGTDCGGGEVCIRNMCEPQLACQSASDCDDPTPLCETASEICVECLDDSNCAGGICDPATFTCRACAADSDCSSGYCALDTGECGDNVADWKYLPTACSTTGTTALAVSSATTINTSDQSQCTGGVVTQTDGPDICVMHYSSISIAAGAIVTFTGTRAVGLVADADISIGGTIDIGADSASGVSGAGGGTRVSGTVPIPPDSNAAAGAGGGGAGFHTAGANGGGAVTNGGAAVDAVASRSSSVAPKRRPRRCHFLHSVGAVVAVARWF